MLRHFADNRPRVGELLCTQSQIKLKVLGFVGRHFRSLRAGLAQLILSPKVKRVGLNDAELHIDALGLTNGDDKWKCSPGRPAASVASDRHAPRLVGAGHAWRFRSQQLRALAGAPQANLIFA